METIKEMPNKMLLSELLSKYMDTYWNDTDISKNAYLKVKEEMLNRVEKNRPIKINEKNTEILIEPFDYCTNCGLIYYHIQNYECVVCHGKLKPIKGLFVPDKTILKKDEK